MIYVCQLKPGSLTDIPFLVRTSALLNHIMPVVSDHLRSLFNRHRKTDLTKRVNAENAVRQSSRIAQLIIMTITLLLEVY